MADNFDMKKFLVENQIGPYAKAKTNEEIGGDIGDAEAEKEMDFLAEYEVIYQWEGNKCYRVDDEGNMDEVDSSYCKRFAEGKEKKDETWFSDMNYFKKEHEGYKLKPTDMVSIGDIPTMTYAQALKKFIKKEQFGGINETVDNRTLMTVEKLQDMLGNLKSNTSTNSNLPTTDKLGLLDAFQEMEELLEDLGADIEIEMNDRYASDYSKRRASELSEESVRMFKSDNPEGDQLVLRFLKGIAQKFDYPVSQAALFVKERIKKLGY